MIVPSLAEMVEAALRKTAVIQNDDTTRTIGLQFKFHQRIESRGPVGGAPGLHDSLRGNQLDVSSNNHSAEHGKSPSCLWIDFSGHAGEGREPLGIQKNLVNPLRSRVEIHFLMERCAALVCLRPRRLLDGLLGNIRPKNGARCQSSEGNGGPDNSLR